jgi:hypothetical protein
MWLTLSKLVRMTLLALVSAAAAQAADVGEIGEEFRQTLLRLAQAGALPADGGVLHVERPAERVVDFGLLVDRDQGDGLRVLGTLPGASAERMGLRAGDRLLEANGTDLRGVGANERMRQVLDGLDDDQRLDVLIERAGSQQRLAGVVDTYELPAMRIELQAASDVGRVVGDETSRCGRISTFHVSPRQRDLFAARLVAIDGRSPGTPSQETFRVSPGRHVLTVVEHIDPREFSGVANLRRTRAGGLDSRTLELDVQPGVTYLLAARLLRGQGVGTGPGDYWQPVIWKERAEVCR